jgi:hypothetical protein
LPLRPLLMATVSTTDSFVRLSDRRGEHECNGRRSFLETHEEAVNGRVAPSY